ncbi:inositol monophosphatase family protein [Hydrogenimonas sp.]
MTPFIRAAAEAALLVQKRLEKGWHSEYASCGARGAGGDISTGIDIFAEEIYIEKLSAFGRIDSEECGMVGDGTDLVVIDPIDGSENAISGLPYFGSSIALQRDGETIEAFIVNLANGDLFYKSDEGLMIGKLGSSDFSPVVPRERATIGIFEKAYANPDLALALLHQKRKFRSPGAVALSLAYAHYVDFVIFAGKRRHYDFAAALWMCEGLNIVEEEELLIVAKHAQTANSLKLLANAHKG